MSADAITYCLEHLTDYRQFERLCSALLSGVGYPSLDPLGGSGDEGRDAIIRTDSAGRTICFAYTVRSDWRDKLREDCSRVKKAGHNPDVLVFACTQALTASEKDKAVASIHKDFGWRLDLHDLERLRVQLVSGQRHLIAQHPSIFVPPFFPQRGGESISFSRDVILIDHVDGDHALATWLSRRLSLAGYRTWCQGTAPMAGETADETVRTLIDCRAARYLPVVSTSSLADSLFTERCTVASSVAGQIVIPCKALISADFKLPSRIEKLEAADFSASWSTGLRSILDALSSAGIAPTVDPKRAAQIALRGFLPTKVTVGSPEPVFANVFALNLPSHMIDTTLSRPLSMAESQGLQKRWAYFPANDLTLISFDLPPEESCIDELRRKYSEFRWRDSGEVHGHRVDNIAKFLARRSLDLACEAKGLMFCHERPGYHFVRNDEKEWVQRFIHVDGQKTSVSLTGTRTKGFGDRASVFRYQVAPRYRCSQDSEGNWTAVIRLYIRVTTLEGVVFEGKEIGRRRKIVGQSWWNKQWLARLLGVVQALETKQGVIEVGRGNRAVRLNTSPMRWECPVGLDVSTVTEGDDIGQEIAGYRSRDESDQMDDGKSGESKEAL